MRYSDIYIEQKQLDNLFDTVEQLPADPEIRSNWAKYLCIRVSGFLETAISVILTEYTRKRAHPRVANRVSAELRFFTNPNMQKVLDLIGSFDLTWAAELERDCTGEIKEAIDSIYSIRNPIAHGESVGLTPASMAKYYKQAKALVSLVDQLCK